VKAIVVKPGHTHSIHMRDMADPPMSDEQVAVKMLRVGLCGTDAEINHGLYGAPPDGEEFLILGHENLGRVADVGKNVKDWKAGDLVVARVRRPCGQCPYCAAGESDCCSSGLYTERGIMRRHGFMAEYYVESPEFLHHVPRAIESIAVLLEPMSVVEKGIDHAFLLQRRLNAWSPGLALVIGAGPVALLAAATLRVRGIRTVVASLEDPAELRAQIATDLGAEYLSVASTPILDLPSKIGYPDLVIEATGNARVVFDAMEILGLNGVLCLLSVTGGSVVNEEPIAHINQVLVLGNRVVVGSVNANHRHYARGVEDLEAIERQWPGTMNRLITNLVPWQEFDRWFSGKPQGIKTTLEIGG
jgi:glucose 1-dehydrogenase